VNTAAKYRRTIDKRNEEIYFGLFALGALAGLLQLASPVQFGLGFEMVALGRNLAEKGSYANPFWVLNTGFTAANPPLYPIFLAVLIKVFRIPSLIVLAVTISNVVANAFIAALLPRVSGLFYGNVKPGIVASLFWLVSAQLMPSWDASFTAAGLLLFCLISASRLGIVTNSVSTLFVGLFLSLLFLSNPSSLLISIPWILYLTLNRKVPWGQTLALIATLLATISIWGGRNHVQLGAFVVRTNLGMTLYASNNDCAESSMIADESHNCFQSHHPNVSLSEALLLNMVGEVEYDRRRTADAGTWIKTHPDKFRALTMDRIREFWFPRLQERPFKASAIWVVTILSIPGLIVMICRRERITLFVIPVLLLYPLMYYVVVSDVRYRYPVLWLSLLPAGYFICCVCCNETSEGIFLRPKLRMAKWKQKSSE